MLTSFTWTSSVSFSKLSVLFSVFNRRDLLLAFHQSFAGDAWPMFFSCLNGFEWLCARTLQPESAVFKLLRRKLLRPIVDAARGVNLLSQSIYA